MPDVIDRGGQADVPNAPSIDISDSAPEASPPAINPVAPQVSQPSTADDRSEVMLADRGAALARARTDSRYEPKDARALLDQRGAVAAAAVANFTDPTFPFSEPISKLWPIEDRVIDDLTARIAQHRLLLLTCIDQEVLYSVAHALAQKHAGWRCREVLLGDVGRLPELTKLRSLLHPSLGSHETFIVVDALSRSADGFLQSLPNTPLEDANISERMTSLRRVVVLTDADRMLANGLRAESKYVAPVDFIGPRIRARVNDSSWAELRDVVWEQFHRGQWGQDERQLLTQLETVLQAGRLSQACHEREEPHRPAYRKTTPHHRIDLSDERPLDVAVAFIAVHFAPLRVDDFQRVLLKVFGDRRLPAKDQVTRRKSKEDVLPKTLSEVWQEQRSRVTREIGLRVMGPTTMIDFESSEMRDQLRERFESDSYFAYADHCRYVDEAGLIFDEKREISEPAMQLTARRVSADPGGYGKDVLDALLRQFVETPPPLGSRVFDAALDGLENEQHRFVLGRIGSLLTLLLEDKASAAVESILKDFLDAGRHGAALQLVSRLTHPSFIHQRLRCMRRIIDESDQTIQLLAYDRLFRWTLDEGERAAVIYEIVAAWADGTNAPHARVPGNLLCHLVDWTLVWSGSTEPNPVVSIIRALLAAEVDGAQRARNILDAISRLEANVITIALGDEPIHAIRLRTFLWIVSRQNVSDVGRAHLWLWEDVQSAWFDIYSERPPLLPFIVDDLGSLAPTFIAMGLADCWIALDTTEGHNVESSNPRECLTRTMLGLPLRQRAILRECWGRFDRGLLRCLGVSWLTDSEATKTRTERRELRSRWSAMRVSLRELLDVTTPVSGHVPTSGASL